MAMYRVDKVNPILEGLGALKPKTVPAYGPPAAVAAFTPTERRRLLGAGIALTEIRAAEMSPMRFAEARTILGHSGDAGLRPRLRAGPFARTGAAKSAAATKTTAPKAAAMVQAATRGKAGPVNPVAVAAAARATMAAQTARRQEARATNARKLAQAAVGRVKVSPADPEARIAAIKAADAAKAESAKVAVAKQQAATAAATAQSVAAASLVGSTRMAAGAPPVTGAATQGQAQLLTAKAVEANRTAAALKRKAQGEANAARSALAAGKKKEAGARVTRHLDAMQKATVAAAQAQKAAQVAKLAATSVQAGAAAKASYIRARQMHQTAPGAAQAEGTKAAALHAKSQQAKDAAMALAARPVRVKLPEILTDRGIAKAASTYQLRVTRRVAAENEDHELLVAALEGLGGKSIAGMDDFEGAVAEYGGGLLGLALASAEFGHAAAFSDALAALDSQLAAYASESNPEGKVVYPKKYCVPEKGPRPWTSQTETENILNKYCDCAYPAADHPTVATWNRRCRAAARVPGVSAFPPWSDLGRGKYGLPAPDLETALRSAQEAASKTQAAAAQAQAAVSPGPAAPTTTATTPPGSTTPLTTTAPGEPRKPGGLRPSPRTQAGGVPTWLMVLGAALGIGGVGYAVVKAAR